MFKRFFLYFFLINYLLLNTLQAAREFSAAGQEAQRRRAGGRHLEQQDRKHPLKKFVGTYPLVLSFQRHPFVALLYFMAIPPLAGDPKLTRSNSTAFKDKGDQSFLPASNSTQLSFRDPIPVENRLELYNDLEGAYRRSEACELGNSALLETLPRNHPARSWLKGCKGINDSYRRFSSLSTLRIPLNGKELPSSFKVVSQHRYVVTDDPSMTLFTGNIMKCVAVAIYNPRDGRAGLAHVAGENIRDLDRHLRGHEPSRTGFHQFMADVAGTENPQNVGVMLLSGSKAHIGYYRRFMEAFGFQSFRIIQEDGWGNPQNHFYNKKFPKGNLAVNFKGFYRIENGNEVNTWMGPPFAAPDTALDLIKVP